MGARQASPRTGTVPTIIGIVLIIIGVLFAGGGGAILIPGIVVRGIERIQDKDGFLAAGSLALSTDGYALSSPAGDPLELPGGTPAVPFEFVTLRVTVTSTDKPVFMGIGAQRDIDRYLGGVEHSEVEGLNTFSSSAEYRHVDGGAPTLPPGELDIWVAEATGSAPQEMQWSLTPGEWGMVVMNADGGAGVDVEMNIAARSGLIAPAANFLTVLGWTLFLLGVAAVIAGGVLLGVGQSGLRTPR